MRKTISFLLTLCLLCGLFTGCASSESPAVEKSPVQAASAPSESQAEAAEKKTWVVGAIRQDSTNISDIQYYTFLDSLIKEEGLDIEVISNDCKQNPDMALSQIDAMIAQNVDCIILEVKDAYSFNPGILAANAAGVPLICHGNTPSEGEFSFIGLEKEAGGRLCGATTKERLGGKDLSEMTILALAGQPGDEWTEKRLAGFCEGLGITANDLDDFQNTQYWSMAEGQAVCENWITAYGLDNIDIIFGGNDQLGLGCVEAIKAAGGDPSKVFISSVDGNEEGCLSVYYDGMSFCALQSPKSMAEGWLACIKNYMAGGEDMVYSFDYSLVDKTTCVDVLKEIYGYSDADIAALD